MLTVWTCWLRLSQAAVTTRRRATRTPSLINYAHSSVLAPIAWVRPDGTGARHRRPAASSCRAQRQPLAGDVLGHAESVACPDALVADGIHHLPHQEHSVPTDRALAQACREGCGGH